MDRVYHKLFYSGNRLAEVMFLVYLQHSKVHSVSMALLYSAITVKLYFIADEYSKPLLLRTKGSDMICNVCPSRKVMGLSIR
jgi:hypothetical protein